MAPLALQVREAEAFEFGLGLRLYPTNEPPLDFYERERERERFVPFRLVRNVPFRLGRILYQRRCNYSVQSCHAVAALFLQAGHTLADSGVRFLCAEISLPTCSRRSWPRCCAGMSTSPASWSVLKRTESAYRSGEKRNGQESWVKPKRVVEIVMDIIQRGPATGQYYTNRIKLVLCDTYYTYQELSV